MRCESVRKPLIISTTVLFHLFLVIHLTFSPVIIVMASMRGIVNASLITYLGLILLSLFWGRAYCGWFCPGCGLQEIMAPLKKRKAGNTKALLLKYIIFFIWMAVILAGYIVAGIHKIDLSYGMTNIPLPRKIILTLGIFSITLLFTLLWGRFALCKYLCWQAPLMVFGTRVRDSLRLPGLRIYGEAANCKSCKACSSNCPRNLDVMQKLKSGNLADPECVLCGNCIDACKFKVLSFKIARPER